MLRWEDLPWIDQVTPGKFSWLKSFGGEDVRTGQLLPLGSDLVALLMTTPLVIAVDITQDPNNLSIRFGVKIEGRGVYTAKDSGFPLIEDSIDEAIAIVELFGESGRLEAYVTENPATSAEKWVGAYAASNESARQGAQGWRHG
ncbi:hypothetical protein HYX70_05220 [Candidatus Saccharibacteria bacterium]|nr:hypothetical protein [Candidatus Saccharibacteria bacterium]